MIKITPYKGFIKVTISLEILELVKVLYFDQFGTWFNVRNQYICLQWPCNIAIENSLFFFWYKQYIVVLNFISRFIFLEFSGLVPYKGKRDKTENELDSTEY